MGEPLEVHQVHYPESFNSKKMGSEEVTWEICDLVICPRLRQSIFSYTASALPTIV